MTPEDRTKLPQPLPPSTSAKDGRRRLLRGGLAAAPALLTLAARPVVAGVCSTSSASVSMSSRTTTAVQCTSGKSPATWGNNGSSGVGDWPEGAVPEGKGQGPAATTFNNVFGSGYDTVPPTTLLDVLRFKSDTGGDGLAKHLVAAYLNAVKGYTPAVVLDVVTAKNIWGSFKARTYYEPSAGIRWFADYAEPANPRGGLIAWIKTTMPR